MRISSSIAIVLLAAMNQAACANPSAPLMHPKRPIEIQRGALGARYQQDGHPIDRADLLWHLNDDAAAAPDAGRYQTLTTLATGLAVVGGGLIGYPLGQKLGGREEPAWPLAYVGAGAVLLTIPLAVWANASLDSAVEAFNQHLPRPADSAPSARPSVPTSSVNAETRAGTGTGTRSGDDVNGFPQ